MDTGTLGIPSRLRLLPHFPTRAGGGESEAVGGGRKQKAGVTAAGGERWKEGRSLRPLSRLLQTQQPRAGSLVGGGWAHQAGSRSPGGPTCR